MTHPLHEHIARQLADKLRERRIVVWYDTHAELTQFVDELRAASKPSKGALPQVMVGDVDASLAEYDGSFFAVRAAVEPLFAGDDPAPLLIYVPGAARDERGSVLLELEKAGAVIGHPHHTLKRWARAALRQRFSDGVVDELLAPEGVTYHDLAHAAGGAGAEPPSLLKLVFDGAGAEELLAAWLASDARDADLEARGGRAELVKLVRSRLGLELREEAPLAKLRALTRRYVLVGELRVDLRCPAPDALASVPVAPTKACLDAVCGLARRLRAAHAAEYVGLADAIEAELRLDRLDLPAAALGSIDTFRFEERALLRRCGELIAAGGHDEALQVIAEREGSFWLALDVARSVQWKAFRYMAELGRVAGEVGETVSQATRAGREPAGWVSAYTANEGWYRLDQAQRRLEAWIARLDDEQPDERPLHVVRRAYLDACEAMATGFTRALASAGWSVAGVPHQTRVHADVVTYRPTPVAYVLVDALRYEMGRELAERLPKGAEVQVGHAIGALPSITPIGMAALLPGASTGFSVVEEKERLGARVDGGFLPDLGSRKKHVAARAPGVVDVTLDDLLGLPPSKLKKKVEGAALVVVRSQEIDHAGETGFTYQARQVMDTVIDNLARALQRLARAGIEHAVVSADHGHLFHGHDLDESMRIDSPGGWTLELHRRCWIGRGGSTPPGCHRVTAAQLGYAGSDLEFVFPGGAGVFKAGGDLAFHHGGASLQELVVPVLTVRLVAPAAAKKSRQGPIVARDLPEAITNRVVSAKFELDDPNVMFGGVVVRPLLVADKGRLVGHAGMAVEAELDATTRCVTLSPGRPGTIVFLLTTDEVASVRVVLQDPTTDAELFRSAELPVRLGVS